MFVSIVSTGYTYNYWTLYRKAKDLDPVGMMRNPRMTPARDNDEGSFLPWPLSPLTPLPSDCDDNPNQLKDYTIYPGEPIPPQVKDAIWPGEFIKTKLPWISEPESPNINLLQDVSYFFILNNVHVL